MKQHQQQGLTLIESIIGIIILGFALSVLVSGVFRSSKTSHEATYQTQAATLGHSLITDILARQFDEQSDPNGGVYRCGEVIAPSSCTSVMNLGRDGATEKDVNTHSMLFNDVDDFIGCWGDSERCQITGLNSYRLDRLIEPNSAGEYKNFTVQINVTYSDLENSSLAVTAFKKLDITIYGSQYAEYTFSAYRGNY